MTVFHVNSTHVDQTKQIIICLDDLNLKANMSAGEESYFLTVQVDYADGNTIGSQPRQHEIENCWINAGYAHAQRPFG